MRAVFLPTLNVGYERQRFLNHLVRHRHVPAVRIVYEAMADTGIVERLNHVQRLL